MIKVALYARVSSDKQAQANTIESQIEVLESKIKEDRYILLNEFKFIDNGYSGSNLERPALEKLRDKVAAGEIEKIYIHSPDRLSRKYVHQMILMDEFKKAGVEVAFINYKDDNTPESSLLLQMQGMIAEYERIKILERNRRGKLHSAKIGNVSSLSTAPYGYDYIQKGTHGMQAQYVINEEQAEVVKQIFDWVGYDRLTLSKICRNLEEMNIKSAKGNTYWSRSSLHGILTNPAYIGTAAFGKTKIGPKKTGTTKFSYKESKRNYSLYKVDKKDWINICVPAIVDENVFKITQEQLDINKKVYRARRVGQLNLLQGLLVCMCCNYSFYGKAVRNDKKKIYYRCTGMDAYRFGGNKPCSNVTISAEPLEMAVWHEVKNLLKNPNRILLEYEKRTAELGQNPNNQKNDLLKKQASKLTTGISRLIDSYTEGYINKEEFEPRINQMKQSLAIIEKQIEEEFTTNKLGSQLVFIVESLESFSLKVAEKLENLDWEEKREIIRMLVKRIEIGLEEINVVFRVPMMSNSSVSATPEPDTKHSSGLDLKKLQHCTRSQTIAPGDASCR